MLLISGAQAQGPLTGSSLRVSGTSALSGPLTFSGTTHAGLTPNKLTTTQRDALTPVVGNTIYNTTTGQLEFYNGSIWVGAGGTPSAPRVQTITDASPVTVTLNSDTTDLGILEGSGTGTITIAAPTGTPARGAKLELWVTSATQRTISFDGSISPSEDMPFPTLTSGNNKTDMFLFRYNTSSSKWMLAGKNFGF